MKARFLILVLMLSQIPVLSAVRPLKAEGGKDPAPSMQGEAAPSEPKVIATWRGGTVTDQEFSSWLRFNGLDPDPALRRERIEEMVLTLALAEIAIAAGRDSDPVLIAEIEGFRDRILVNALKKKMHAEVVISQAEIDGYFVKHPDGLTRPRKIRLRNLFLRYPPDASKEQKEAVWQRISELRREIVAGADFESIARAKSDSQTRYRGGLIGNLAIRELPPHLASAVDGLNVGETTEIIETPDGLSVVRVEGFVEAHHPPLEQRKKEIVAHLKQFRFRESWDRMKAELLASAAPKYDLAAARASGPETLTVARFDNQKLILADLIAVLRARPKPVDRADLGDDNLTRIMGERIFETVAAFQAQAQGLDRGLGLDERVVWQRSRLLAAATVRNHVNDEIEPVSEERARRYFESNPEEFTRLPHFDLSLIQLNMEPGREQNLYRTALRIRSDLASGDGDFQALARENSVHPSASTGGSLGSVSRRQLAAYGSSIFRVVQELEVGEVSEILQEEGSLFIFRLDGTEPARQSTWEEAADRAEKLLGTREARSLQQGYEDAVRRKLDLLLVDAVSVSDHSR